ncbi:MAG: hypothetical protein K2J80_11165 [Oscillospiraceae bacterium]|nr:hypothetical protein [Oscillospiraceae bacterium]
MDEAYSKMLGNEIPEPIVENATETAAPEQQQEPVTEDSVQTASDDQTETPAESEPEQLDKPAEEAEEDTPEQSAADDRAGGFAVSINEKLDELTESMAEIKAEMLRLAAYDTAVKELKQSLTSSRNTSSKLHEEVEEYKKGTYFTNIKPFLIFLINHLCDLKNSKKEYLDDKEAFVAENSEAVFNEIINLLDFFIAPIEHQLTIFGVTIKTYEAESDFIPGEQNIVRTVKTEDPALSNKNAEILSDCYMYEKNVLRPANVLVYKN